MKKFKQQSTNSRKVGPSDNNGIRAETIKQIFNVVLKQESCTPEIWRRIRIKLATKKGTKKTSETIARFVLYKLFSTIPRSGRVPTPPSDGSFTDFQND